ncbi:MAG TPA: hypothetical protein VHS56_02005 [Candidatus Cybelea sp.]|jgi:DNA-binding beta-propeller fold protein YncE|nr:hypothetical protein [Candidatus Cybelea sp.]
MPPGSAARPQNASTGSAQHLFVENVNSITEFDSNGNLVRTITDGIPYEGFNTGAIAFDSRGTMYVITGSFNISIYAPHSRKFLGTITTGLQTPLALAVDRSDNLYVANEIGENVSVYPRGHKKPTLVITAGINDPDALAFDSQENLYVANWFGNTITVYSPDGNPIRTIQDAVLGPESLAFDTKGRLYAADGAGGYGSWVTIYSPQSDKLLATIFSGRGPTGVALNSSGQLFVTNADSNTLTAYERENSHEWPLLFKIRKVYDPRTVLVDASNNLYLICCKGPTGEEIVVYPPGGKKPLRTMTDGVYGPHAIAFGPP